ncbi:non-ribosomal peptide synthetase, partial [Clostridium gasigenes]|uniref:non-ribosomal peptide synthetase n=1 Tax=Clostridium gasigenes TaxID=94869 RepID=UPI001C0ADC32
ETIDRFLVHFKEVLCRVIETPESLIGEIQVITKEEEDLILNKFNDTYVGYDKEKTVVDMFEEQVKKTPNNVAVVYEEEKLTYKELDEKANILGAKLRYMGIKPEDFVAIAAEKSLEMAIGILGIIKAGGAYVPIDPKYPEDRINYIISDCKPKALLTYKAHIKSEEIPIIDLADNKVFEGKLESLEKVNKPTDLLYVIYTSGTTGKPKGVMIEHSGVNSLRTYFINSLKVSANDRILQFSNIAFDGSVWDMTMSLLIGATLYVINQDKMLDLDYISEYANETTIIAVPPQYYQQLKTKGQRLVVTAGSESSKDVVEKAIKEGGAYLNSYGPTEATVCATQWYCDKKEDLQERIPIGKPIDNKKIYICYKNSLCGIGMPGELCIAGDGLARGYLNRPELTAEKFIDNPYGEGRLYKTGDLSRWLPDGNIEYLGRIDEQVKIRGFRIELGEISNVLRRIDYINDVAVITREDSHGEKAIYAYVVSNVNVDIKEVKEEISKELPDYMIPEYMMEIEKIPVNRNGKLDKNSLPDIVKESDEEYIAPRNQIEKKLCSVFEEILGVNRVGLQDDFFELGGDSIKLLRLIHRLEKEAFNITFSDIKRNNTIKLLSESLGIVSYGASDEEINNENKILINRVIFLKEVKECFIDSKLYKELDKYNSNMEGSKKCNQYVPLTSQEDFLRQEKPVLSGMSIEVVGKVSKDQMIDAIRSIINAQAALRTIYNSKDNILIEVSKEDWYIPYFDKREYDEVYSNISGSFNCGELVETNKLLSKVFVAEKNNNHHLVVFYVNHALWDFMTTEILLGMLKNTLVNNKKSVIPEETYYEYVNRKRNNSKAVELFDSIENIENNIENYKKKISDNYDYVYKVIATKKLTPIEKKELLENSLEWILDKYYKIINIDDIKQIPFTMVHQARESKTLNTLGLYVDKIPCLYNASKKYVKGWNKKGQIDSNESYELYKEKIPTESKVFKELSINIIILDFNNENSELKNNTVKIIDRYDLDQVQEEIEMVVNDDVLAVICPVYAKKELEEEEIQNIVKNIFDIA